MFWRKGMSSVSYTVRLELAKSRKLSDSVSETRTINTRRGISAVGRVLGGGNDVKQHNGRGRPGGNRSNRNNLDSFQLLIRLGRGPFSGLCSWESQEDISRSMYAWHSTANVMHHDFGLLNSNLDITPHRNKLKIMIKTPPYPGPGKKTFPLFLYISIRKQIHLQNVNIYFKPPPCSPTYFFNDRNPRDRRWYIQSRRPTSVQH
jgi:hypothetical protein